MRSVVITGAASGIGRATAEIARARGWRVIGLDRHDADVVADLSTPGGRQDGVGEVERLCGDGALDAVIACAGVGFVGHDPQPPNMIARINFFGATAVLAGLRPLLARSDAGRAVAISSNALMLYEGGEDLLSGYLAGDEAAAAAGVGDDPGVAYSSSKLALARWVKREAVKPEWAGAQILLNAIAPGAVQTPMIAELLSQAEGRAMLEEATPMRLGRPGKPAEIGELACFLASPQNGFVTGQTIFCDGGGEATRRPRHI